MKKFFGILCVFLLSLNAFAEDTPRYDFHFSPLGILVGPYTFDLAVRVNPQWTLGPEFSYWSYNPTLDNSRFSGGELTAYGLGVRADWFSAGVYKEGLFVSPRVMYYSEKATASDMYGTAGDSSSGSGLTLGCLVGYAWFWDELNIMAGAGYTLGLSNFTTPLTINDPTGDSTKISNSVSGLATEISVGWTF